MDDVRQRVGIDVPFGKRRSYFTKSELMQIIGFIDARG